MAVNETEVFMAPGTTIWAWMGVQLQSVANIGNTQLVAWEPLPFWMETPGTPSFSYTTSATDKSTGQLHFSKLVTCTSPSHSSFMFLYAIVT